MPINHQPAQPRKEEPPRGVREAEPSIKTSPIFRAYTTTDLTPGYGIECFPPPAAAPQPPPVDSSHSIDGSLRPIGSNRTNKKI
ncbi:hypothetical protein M0802_010363 [Mischocyttarus mexicanus]|nr:hypothetical protein M0802_010363 [Mischocyttarus mexicanus]